MDITIKIRGVYLVRLFVVAALLWDISWRDSIILVV